MENQLQVFNNEQFEEIRVKQTKDGKVLFCLRDLCKPLALRTNDVQKRLKDGYVSIVPIVDSLGRQQNTIFVTEAGMYKVILQSRKDEAEKFQDWICEDVLPSIRKHGMYMTDDVWSTMMLDPAKFGEILIAYGKEKKEKEEALKKIKEQEQTIERREEQLLNQAPSVAFSESYNGAEGYIQATQFAKALNSVGIKKLPNGKNIGRNNLLNWLRDSGYVNNDYQPYQRYIKYFGTKQNIYKDPNTDESKVGKPTLLISFKGQQYFIKKFGYKDFLIKYDMLDKNLL